MAATDANRTIALYPWFKFFQNLIFYQAVWFLFFQQELTPSEAILLYAVYDLSSTILEVPSGYMSDRWGRRITLVAAGVAGVVAGALLTFGAGFAVFALAQICLGASAAFASGTDSAILYESLADADRADEVEAQELRAWRFSFAALAASAVTGGALAQISFTLPFLGTALAFGAATLVALALTEPKRTFADMPQGGEWARLASLKGALSEPVLIWLMVLGVLMYGFSHLPFVFGQPFILEALDGIGLAGDAPLVSGAVTTAMMLISVATSLAAPRLRRRLGLVGILLVAFAIQIGLIAVLALTSSAAAIAILFLRMVPDSLSRPFVLARIQPELSRESRATYLSLRSLAARLTFAASLALAAGTTSATGTLIHDDIRAILGVYAVVGVVALIALAVTARHIALDRPQSHQP
jgi:MFS family permease